MTYYVLQLTEYTYQHCFTKQECSAKAGGGDGTQMTKTRQFNCLSKSLSVLKLLAGKDRAVGAKLYYSHQQ